MRGSKTITKKLQREIFNRLTKHLNKKHYAVAMEWPTARGKRFDIAIGRHGNVAGIEPSHGIVIVEIEHWSNDSQAQENHDKIYPMAKRYGMPRATLFHVINECGNLKYLHRDSSARTQYCKVKYHEFSYESEKDAGMNRHEIADQILTTINLRKIIRAVSSL